MNKAKLSDLTQDLVDCCFERSQYLNLEVKRLARLNSHEKVYGIWAAMRLAFVVACYLAGLMAPLLGVVLGGWFALLMVWRWGFSGKTKKRQAIEVEPLLLAASEFYRASRNRAQLQKRYLSSDLPDPRGLTRLFRAYRMLCIKRQALFPRIVYLEQAGHGVYTEAMILEHILDAEKQLKAAIEELDHVGAGENS